MIIKLLFFAILAMCAALTFPKSNFNKLAAAIGVVSSVLLAVYVFTLDLYDRVEVLEKKIAHIDTMQISIKHEQPDFLFSDDPEKDLDRVLEYYNVKHPEIVKAQAILETGHFRSRVFKEYNNLFGLYNSYKKDYYRFSHWTESVAAYINYIQYRYKPGEDYYGFLERIGYAEDPLYIKKLQIIRKKGYERLQ